MCLFLWDEERNNLIKIINIPKQIIKACTCLLSIKMKPKQSDFRLLLENSASKSKLDYLGEEFGFKRVLIFGIGHTNAISTCWSRASCSPSSKPYSSTPTVLGTYLSTSLCLPLNWPALCYPATSTRSEMWSICPVPKGLFWHYAWCREKAVKPSFFQQSQFSSQFV